MGNRNCGLFSDGRDGEDHLYVDGLSDDENRLLKEIYRYMDISSKFMPSYDLRDGYNNE